MNNINELKPIQGLSPFKQFCCTIGNLPSSYLVSMTYEEQLLWLCDYLKNTVIPTVNNNASAVQELQQLYVQLKNYVDNYFSSLDVQNEINNKLDIMASDGTLAQIIEDYTTILQLDTRVTNIENNTLNEMVVIGDSYTSFSNSTWAENLASQLHLNLNKHAVSSMGYAHQVNNQTFINLLGLENQSIRNKVGLLICYGGINDYDISYSNLQDAVENFIVTAKSTYPNAKILLVGPQTDATKFNDINIKKEINAISTSAIKHGVAYANAYDWLWNNPKIPYTTSYAKDRLHPSTIGYNIITSKMLALINGSPLPNAIIDIGSYPGITADYIETSNTGNVTHLNASFSNVTIKNGVFSPLLKINNDLIYFMRLNQRIPVYGLSSFSDTAYVTKLIGYTRINDEGGIYVVNITGDDYTGAIQIQGDLVIGNMKE